jgi:hypothetical protein
MISAKIIIGMLPAGEKRRENIRQQAGGNNIVWIGVNSINHGVVDEENYKRVYRVTPIKLLIITALH